MAEYTIKDSLSSVAEYIGEAVATKENAFRVSTMPAASADYAGEIYQYVGATDASYTNGYYYECAEDNGVYGWQQINVQPSNESGQTIQYDEMPEASEDNEDVIVQYIGATTSVAPIYTNGYFYKCVAQGTDPETYAWENVDVQKGGSSSGGITSDNISEMNVEFNSDYSVKRVYIIVEDGFEVQPFSTASWDNITEALKRHYAGELDITDYYNLGETKTITVSAMSEDIAYSRTYAQQNVKFKIVGFNYYSLETSIGDSTKSALVLHTEDCLEASSNLLAMDSTLDKTRAWETCDRRNWLRGTFYNALPQGVKSNIKTITHDVREGMVDDASNIVTLSETVFFPTKEELTYSEGGLPYYNSSESLIKGVGNTSKVNYYLSSCFVSQNARFYDIVGNNGNFGSLNATNNYPDLCCIAPMICM